MEANRANVTKFEVGKVTLASLLRYVARLNRAEFRWLVFSMILLALISVAAPIFNEQVFSVVIPNADRALMVQIFLMSLVFILGTVTLQYANGVIGARMRRTSEWHLQTALMDRLLDLPSAFFHEHSRGAVGRAALPLPRDGHRHGAGEARRDNRDHRGVRRGDPDHPGTG